MDTKNGHPAVNFPGALVASGREFLGDSRERAVTGGPFTADSLFPPKLTQRKSNQSALWIKQLASLENITHNTVEKGMI